MNISSRFFLWLPFAAAALALAGCQGEIDDTYGRRSGHGAASVNGTTVLGDMFRSAGHTVYSRSALTPRMNEKAQCIVWFPDDLDGPTKEVRRWFADWLAAKPGRTLIYVGRDFDAWPFYWEKVGKPAPFGGVMPGHRLRLKVEKKKANAEAAEEPKAETAEVYEEEDGEEDENDPDLTPNQWDAEKESRRLAPWFTIDEKAKLRKVSTLQGNPRWVEDIVPEDVEIELRGRMTPAAGTEILLASEKDMLVGRRYVGRGQMILVANGSFLLNVPLVNHEHRKLAGKLIDAAGPAGQTVVFLESGPGGPPIRSEDPQGKSSVGLDILMEHPYCWIFLHILVACALYCFARWPLFGPPRELPCEPASDFGRHIAAMAELLSRSRDRPFAYRKLLGYRQKAEEKRR